MSTAADRLARITPRPHGTRARYAQGCRCGECRKANCTYERVRSKMIVAGLHVPNPIVPADGVRAHVVMLTAAGVGVKRVSELARVPRATLAAIVAGKRQNLRQLSAARVLAIAPTLETLSGNAIIPSRRYKRMLHDLLGHDFTRQDLARMLGCVGEPPSLQIGPRITVRKARQIVALWRRYMTIEGV